MLSFDGHLYGVSATREQPPHAFGLGGGGYYSSVEHTPRIQRVLCYAGTQTYFILFQNFITGDLPWQYSLLIQIAY